MEIAGEAAGRLTPGFRDRHPEIPWNKIIGMRHRLVHAYCEIDDEQVWTTVTKDLPPVVERLRAILAAEFSGQV